MKVNDKAVQHDSQYWKNAKDNRPRKQFQINSADPISKNGKFEVYCVDCGIKASVVVAGTAAFHILKGLTRAEIEMKADFTAGLHIGVAAEYAVERERIVDVLTLPIAGIHVPKIITIGPVVSIRARANAKMEAQGTLLIGGSMELQGIRAKIDLQDKDKNISPTIQPVFTPVFEAQGDITASLTLGLPVSIEVAIDIASSTVRASGGITVEPALKAAATYSISSSLVNGAVKTQSGDETCNGVSAVLSFQNSFYAQAEAKFFSVHKKTPRAPIGKMYEKALARHCIGKKKSPSVRRRQYDNSTVTLANSTDGQYEATWDPVTLPAYDVNSPDLPFKPLLSDFYTDENNNGVNDSDEPTWLDDLEYFYPDLNDFTSADVISGSNGTKQQDAPVQVSKRQSRNGNVDTAFEYSILTDTTFSMNLVHTKEGYVSVQDVTGQTLGNEHALWQQYNDVIVGDSHGRTLLFYHAAAERWGWSPLRVAAPDKLEFYARMINLINMNFVSTTKLGPPSNLVSNVPAAVYVASDTQQNAYWPVVCNFKPPNTPSRVFITADLDASVKKLIQESNSKNFNTDTLANTWFGGPISECQPLPLVNGEKGTNFS